jgi:ankyrin repeat protein/nucleoside-triphosphatase THEP1
MVKFGPEDDEYEKARLRIQRLTQRTLEKWESMSKDFRADDAQDECLESLASETLDGCLRSLAFRQMHDRSQDIETASKKTCEWLLRHEEYTKWAACGRDMLWIKGKPGSGKSTLLKYILDNHQPGDGDIVLSFFFHGRGEELQRTPFGLFRCLLHQILKLAPGSLSDLLNTYKQNDEEYGETNDKWQWHPEELWRFLESSIQKILETRSIWLFVDALDECGKDHAVNLVSKFRALCQSCASTRSQLYICFTCRHYPILDAHCEFEICTEDENGDDISTFVHSQLSGICAHVSTPIPALITTRANGIFMWARLVVQQVLNLDREGEDLGVIEAKICSIPQDLDDLYKGLIDTMKSPSLKLIQWICFATRPLSLIELRWVMALDPNLLHRSLREFQFNADYPDDDRLKRRVQTLSCGLAEVVSSNPEVVQFIHQSVKEFFVEKGLSILDKTRGSHEAIASAHCQLSRSCIYYLSMNEFEFPAILDPDHIWFQFPLLKYATTFWMTHARESDKRHVSQSYLLENCAGQSNNLIERWVRIYGLLETTMSWEESTSDDCPPPGTRLEHVMSRYEMRHSWCAALERRDQFDIHINAKDSHSRTPLSWAAAAGHESIVQLLLVEGAWMEVADRHFGRTPLLWAAVAGHDGIVRMLLGRGAKIEAMDKEGLTALLTAVTAGKEAVVRDLLNCGARTEVPDKSEGETPLWRAAAAGHEAIVKMLLDRGARTEVPDKRYGQTPLWRAATAGHEAIVKMLLDRDARTEAADKHYGQTPLWRAAIAKHNTVSKLLLDRGASTEVADNEGQSLLCQAVESGNEALVQQLLEHGANIEATKGISQATLPWFKRLLGQKTEAEVRPHYGLTPLCRAAKAGHEAIARLLLDRGANIENADKVGRTPLQWAVVNKGTAVVELLLERGACVESRDENGRTPLSWAASGGFECNAQLLLDKGANIESRDIYGATPLLRAVLNSHEAIVQMLLDAGADIKAKSKNGQTPLSLARTCGHQGMVSLLQSYLEPSP